MEVRTGEDAIASFVQRAGAYLIDSLLVAVLWLLAIIAAVIPALVVDPEGDSSDLAIGMVVFLSGPTIWFVYEWACNARGTSVGKKIMSLAIEPSGGRSSPGVATGLARTLGEILGLIPLGLGFWWALWDNDRQTWHDKIAGTRVVRLAAPAVEGEAPVPRRLPWARRKQDAERALSEALEAPLPLGAADMPFELVLASWSAGVRQGVSLAVMLSALVTRWVLWGLAIDLPTLLLLMGVVLFALASPLDLSALNRSLRISGEGIRLEKVHRTYTVPWWEVQRIEAKSDISSIRVLSRDRCVTCDCRYLTLDKRKGIVIAIRARLPAGLEIEEWPKQGQLLAQARSVLLSTAALGLFIAASMMGALAPDGHVLGIRCGVSSQYLQTLFGLPAERGCVILRVSGAAEDAGLRQGDLMVAMNDIPITSGSQFTIVFERAKRRDFTFRVLRSGQDEPMDFHVTLGAPGGPFREDADDPFFYYLRARGDTHRTNIQRDIADYTRAIELAPNFDLANLYRGNLYEEIGDYRSALRDYRKAIQLSPNLGEAHSVLAYFLSPDQIPDAMASIKEAIRLDECEGGFLRHNVDCAVDYSLLARLEGYSNVGVAVGVANEAVRFYPDLPDPYFELAEAYEHLGNVEKASEYAERYLQLADDWPYGPSNPARLDHAKEILRESSEQ